MKIKLKDFGKDHWSTFAYLETCCVDNRGIMDARRLRINEPLRGLRSNGLGWNPEYATRIKDGSKPSPEHDDISCLDDLEREGLIEWASVVNMTAFLTEKGIKVAEQLRKHKMNGGQFGTFRV